MVCYLIDFVLCAPRGAAVDILQLSGSHSQTSVNASQGTTMSRSEKNSGPYAAKGSKR
jgi:hypothetical protein